MDQWLVVALCVMALGAGCSHVSTSFRDNGFGDLSACDVRRDGYAWCAARERAKKGGLTL